MRTLTLALIFLAACADESRYTPKPVPVALYVRSGPCVTVEQISPWTVKLSAQGMPHVGVDIRFAGGASEVWVVPQGTVMMIVPKQCLAEVYPVFALNFPDYPVAVRHNGPHTLQTTTGQETYPAHIVLWNGGGNGSWEVR
jgi:hypothetical protein